MTSASIRNPSTSDLELTDITPPTTPEVFDERADEQTEPPTESQDLSGQLIHLVDSIATVEELSRQAREAAVGDLAQYESLAESHEDYAQGLCRAAEIREQAAHALEQAFGQSAKSAAQSLLTEATRVHDAFEQLVDAWQGRADAFLADHPDVALLVAERRAEEEQARLRDLQTARDARRDALLAALNSALEAGVIPEARRALALLEREMPDETEVIRQAKRRIVQAIRQEKDIAARQALATSSQLQDQGDLEAALAVIEQIEVEGLSMEVSQDVFGRWSDTCSRLAQSVGARLVRYAPTQGRGLILLDDPSRGYARQIFSALGMGPDYPPNAMVSLFETGDAGARHRAATADAILRNARPFREATMPTSQTSWATYAPSPQAPVVVRH